VTKDNSRLRTPNSATRGPAATGELTEFTDESTSVTGEPAATGRPAITGEPTAAIGGPTATRELTAVTGEPASVTGETTITGELTATGERTAATRGTTATGKTSNLPVNQLLLLEDQLPEDELLPENRLQLTVNRLLLPED